MATPHVVPFLAVGEDQACRTIGVPDQEIDLSNL